MANMYLLRLLNEKMFYKITSLILYLSLLSSYTYCQNYSLDEFDDLELNNTNRYSNQKKSSENDKRLILFDDKLYLLDDDFEFGKAEVGLKKLELNPDEMETLDEYQDFLNAFFENSEQIGSRAYKQGNASKNNYSTSNRNTKNKYSKNKPSQSRNNNMPKQGKFGFGLSTIMGATIPVGQNLTSRFTTGSNFGLSLKTPISFDISGFEAKVGTDLYFSSMSAASESGNEYKLTNLVGTIGIFPIESFELKAGLGLSPSSIGDYGKMLLSLPLDINYYLPFNVSGFQLALNLHLQETLGVPDDVGTEDTKGTSEFINVGLFIKTPLVF